MTMWASLIVSLGLVCTVLGAPLSFCPESCSCNASGIYLEARCKSLDFLNKPLSTSQLNSILTLDVSHNSISKVNPNIRNLRRLRHLNLQSNKIQQITATSLPKSLEYLDLSGNSIRHLTQDLHLLPALNELNLLGNPILCDCDSVFTRNALLKNGVIVAAPKCDSPAEFRGKSWTSVVCKQRDVENLFEDMQGDTPYEGSGSGDVALITDNEANEKPEKWDSSIEEEFIRIGSSSNSKTLAPTELPPTEAPEFEGSGDEAELTTSDFSLLKESQETTTEAEDEDYDDYDESTTVAEPPAVTVDMSLLNRGRIKACHFNCSTPSPLDDSNGTDSAPFPGLFSVIQILANDLNIIGGDETVTSTEAPTTSVEVPVEISVEQDGVIDVDKKNTTTDAEIIKKDFNDNEATGNISEEPKQSNSTFIFLSVLLLLIVCLVIYAIGKKRKMKRRNRQCDSDESVEEKEAIPEEIELLKKPVSQTDKPNGTHETIPLMNGHNENQNKNAEENLPSDANNEIKSIDDGDEVELRPKKTEQKNLLTPETKRVTIKATEIPNSTPKTPILVTRHLNSDGNIVTTPDRPNIDEHV